MSEQTAQLLRINGCVSQNSGERSAFELTMERHDQRDGLIRVFQTHMASTLAHRHPPELAQGCDELRSRDDRLTFGQAGSGSRRRTIPICKERPSSRNPST